MSIRIRGERLAHETLEGEVVIVDQVTGSYFSITGGGSEIWALLEVARDVADVAAALAARVGADVAADVTRFVAELRAEGLVVDADEAVAIAPGGAPLGWSSPRLEKFTDLQSLVLLDPIHDVGEAGWPHQAPK